MQPFFSPAGAAALDAVMRCQPLLAFDFDGTLAPIVDHPDDARIPPAVAVLLGKLARRLPVAIITGRKVDDVRGRLGFEPRYVVGNHGIEDPALPLPDAARAALDEARDRIAAGLAVLGDAGVGVEDKGYSIALHYRLAADPAAALAAIDAVLGPLGETIDRFGGKSVVNVTGLGVPDKADALVSLVERCGAGAAVFAGDDVNDEPVFARLEPPSLSLRVGGATPGSRARFHLDDHASLVVVLQRIQAWLEGSVARPGG